MKLHLPELHYNLGYVLHQKGELVRSGVAYRQAIALDPTFAQAHYGLAVVLGAQGRYEAAIDRYKQVIALQPSAKAYNNLGCILAEQGQIAEALQMYRQALALEPSATLHSNFGKAIEAEDPVAAMIAYRRAIELQPDVLSVRYNLGHALQQQGQHDAAIQCFEQLLQRDPSYISAHTGCGLAHTALGKLDCALDHFRQALLPQQDYITAFCVWADQQSGTDELSLARKACSQFLQALLPVQIPVPTCSDRQPHRKMRFRFTKAAKGAVALENRTSENCTHGQAQQHLAQTYLHLGNVLTQYGGAKQYQQAEIYYQKALQIRSQDLELYLRLGECLSRQQRWNAALMVYQLALTVYPNQSQLYQNLGQILEQQQRWAEAISYYQQALKLRDDCHPPQQIALSNYSPLINTTGSNSISGNLSTVEPSDLTGYISAQAWIVQNRLGRYVALNSNANHDLIPENISNQVTEKAIPTHILETYTASTTLSLTSAQPTDTHIQSDSTCDGLNCQRCLKRVVQQFAPIHLGHGIYACQPQSQPQALQHISQPFVAEIPHGQAWMVPYQTAWMITNSIAILTPDQYLLTDVSREYPGQLPGCCQSDADRFLQMQSNQNAASASQSSGVNVEQIAGRVAVLSGLSGHNYFHWMVDILPRFALLQQGGVNLTDVDWFWINDPQQSFQRETLQRLGIPLEKILAGDRHPQIQAEQLVVPSFVGNLGWLEPWALKFLRQQFLGLADPDLPCYERIYISRAKAHHRRVLNEAAVLEKLEAAGFVSVELESMTLAEQIALFSHAKVVMAPHGGGLTNLLFCSPETQVLEFVAPQYTRHYYWVMSQQLGLQHFFMVGAEIACAPIQRLMYPSPLMEDIWVNITALNAALKQLALV